jgi:hypothetical protein
MQRIRRGGILLGLALLATMITVAPAAADPALELTGSRTFEDLDPCDPPNPDIVTLAWNVEIHQHENNTVFIFDTTVNTANGYVGDGHETTVLTNNNEVVTYNIVVTHPDTGDKYTVKGNIKVVQGDVQVDNFTLTCVKDV